MKLKALCSALIASVALAASASATTLTSYIAMDNAYQVYISTSDSTQGVLFGSGNNWPQTFIDTTTLLAGQDYYLHVHGIDQGGIAAFLGQFTLSGTDHLFSNNSTTLLTNTDDWLANTTGFNGSYTAVSMVNGTNGVGPWGERPNISLDAQWIWQGNPLANQQGYSTDVYFSTKISSQSVPDLASTASLMMLALGSLLVARRRLS